MATAQRNQDHPHRRGQDRQRLRRQMRGKLSGLADEAKAAATASARWAPPGALGGVDAGAISVSSGRAWTCSTRSTT